MMSNVQRKRTMTGNGTRKSKCDDDIMSEDHHCNGSGGGPISKSCWPSSWNNCNWFGYSFNSSRNSADFVQRHRRIKSEPVTGTGEVSDMDMAAGTCQMASNGKSVGPFKLPSMDEARRSKRSVSLIGNLPSRSAAGTAMKKINSTHVQNEEEEENPSETGIEPNALTTRTSQFGHGQRNENFDKGIPSNVSWGCGLILRLYMKCGADFGDTEADYTD